MLVCRGELNLHVNQLQSLSEGFGNIIVGTLSLGYNQLQSLPEGFGNRGGGSLPLPLPGNQCSSAR